MEKYQFFNTLSDDDKSYLKEHSKYIEVPKDVTLFFQGDTCNDILLLDEGCVKLFIHGDLDEVMPLYEIRPGEQCIVNTSSTLSNTSAIATAQTVSAIKGWLVPQRVSRELMVRSFAYQEYIFSLFSLKFSALTTLIEDIKFKKLDQRILEFLKSLDESIIEITHETIANELGTSRVVVSRTLKDLENKNHIRLHRKKIELLSNVT